jgi:hypothetical protein
MVVFSNRINEKKMKKLNIHDPKILDILINKELEKYNTNIDEIKKLPENKIDGILWYVYYTFDSIEEYLNWKNFCIDFLKNKVMPKLNDQLINKEFQMLNLQFGLKCNFEIENLNIL